MCSSANPTEEALQQSQAAFTNTLQSSFSTAFAANQAILKNVTATLTSAIANPKGFTPAQLTAMRTGATDTTAAETNTAQKSVNAYLASHGGPDLGSGVGAQITGEVQTAGAVENSRQQNEITIANANLQNENYWRAIQGLTQVGAAYNPQGYAGVETGSANATTNASNAVTAEQQQGWGNAFGVVQGVAGLATAASNLPLPSGGSPPAYQPTGVPTYGS